MFNRIKKWLDGWKPCKCRPCQLYQGAIDGFHRGGERLAMDAVKAWDNARDAIDPVVKRKEEERGWRLAQELDALSKKPLPDPDIFPPCEFGRDLERLFYHRADLDHRLNELKEKK